MLINSPICYTAVGEPGYLPTPCRLDRTASNALGRSVAVRERATRARHGGIMQGLNPVSHTRPNLCRVQ